MRARGINLLLACVSWTAQAANPSFGDFNSTQFATNGNKVAIKSGALQTNGVFKTSLTLDGHAVLTNAPAQVFTNDAGMIHAVDTTLSIYGLGKDPFNAATITNSSNIYIFGDTVASGGVVITNSTDIFAYGYFTLGAPSIDSSSLLYAYGDYTMSGAAITNSQDLFAYGAYALENSTITGSSYLFAYGYSAMDGATLTNSSYIYSFGNNSLGSSVLSNSTDIYAIGNNAGAGLAGDGLSHIFVLGTGGTATNSNDFVFGDSLYNYFFPGASASFANYISLSGNTNRYTDNGTTLLRNGVAIGGGTTVSVNGTNVTTPNFQDTATVTWAKSGSNITAAAVVDTTQTNIVTLSQTGTNVSAMNFALVARGGVFKLALTNNAYIGAPSGVANTAFSHAWLMVQQPSTGTCALTFTNGFYAFSEGVAPVIDTNNGAVSVFEFVSDVFTNGLLHGSVSTPSKLIP